MSKDNDILFTLSSERKVEIDKELLENFYIQNLLKQIEEIKKQTEWQLIETAPRDGTRILVKSNDECYAVAYWCDEYGQQLDINDEGFLAETTHWMPLPTVHKIEE